MEIVRLYWTSSGGHEEAEPKFEHVNRLNPGAIFIEAAYLEGSLACMGSGPDWILWDWKENTAVKVDLESSSVSDHHPRRSKGLVNVNLTESTASLGGKHDAYDAPP